VPGALAARGGRCAASHTRRRLQKCNRLQPVGLFAGSNRTCMAKLAQHNERRREAYAARKGPKEAEPGTPPAAEAGR